jgi:hypothetical protein
VAIVKCNLSVFHRFDLTISETKRKTKNEKRKTKNEKRKTKNESESSILLTTLLDEYTNEQMNVSFLSLLGAHDGVGEGLAPGLGLLEHHAAQGLVGHQRRHLRIQLCGPLTMP